MVPCFSPSSGCIKAPQRIGQSHRHLYNTLLTNLNANCNSNKHWLSNSQAHDKSFIRTNQFAPTSPLTATLTKFPTRILLASPYFAPTNTPSTSPSFTPHTPQIEGVTCNEKARHATYKDCCGVSWSKLFPSVPVDSKTIRKESFDVRCARDWAIT